MRDRIECRTAVLGGHLFACTHCDRQPYAYPSCRNRSCPKCHGRDIEAWRAARHSELLPVEYFHVVFTVPAELREAARRHPKTVYDVLMKASASALTTLAADPHYVGGRIGVLAVLHTWTRTLTYHPHVHCLVPGGGLSSDGQWRSARPGFLRPVRALSRLFRGRFRALLTRALPDLEVPASAWKKEWVVYAKPSVQGVDAVLNYLGRYVHRIAITNNRILAIEDGRVTFRYPWCGQTRGQTMTLDAHEFIRRFLPHVLPKGTPSAALGRNPRGGQGKDRRPLEG